MTALNLLDVSYYVVTAIEWLGLAALVVLGLWFVIEFHRAHEADARDDRVFAHPSNVTVMPHVRPFDWADDEVGV